MPRMLVALAGCRVEGRWSNLIAENSELDRLEGIYRSLLKNAGAS